MQDTILQNLEEFSSKVPNLEYVKEIKSGKEATVHLVTDGKKLYALKMYKARANYSTRLEYINIERVVDARSRRAIKKKTKTGKSKLDGIWTQREYSIMKMLNQLSPSVPKVYANSNNAILFQFLGNIHGAAPKLIDIRLSLKEAEKAFEDICNNILLFIDIGFVHGDLSPYNILWWDDRIHIIDFPQSLDISNNRNAFEKLIKDLESLEDYFSKYLDAELIANEFLNIKEQFYLKNTYG